MKNRSYGSRVALDHLGTQITQSLPADRHLDTRGDPEIDFG